MATKNFRSTVLEPTGEFAYGDKLRFTALATVGEVLKGSFSETTIGEDGVYGVDLQYGKHRIDYKPYEGVWRHFADVEVNADTLATTLQDLALSSVPVTDETILVLQGILADAEVAKTESATLRDEAAASAAAAEAAAEENKTALDACIQKKDFTFVHDKTANSFELFIPHTSNFAYAFNLMIWSSQEGMNVNSAKNFGIYGTTATSTIRVSEIYGSINIDNYVSIGSHRRDDNGTYIQVFCQVWSGDFAHSQTFTVSVRDVYSGIPDIIEAIEIVNLTNRVKPIEEILLHEITHEDVTHYDVSAEEARIIGIPIAAFDAALADQRANDFFLSEKNIALQIMADFNLGTGEHEIAGSDMADVRAYIQSIDPAKGLKTGHLQRAKIPRPSIFDRYKKNPYEL